MNRYVIPAALATRALASALAAHGQTTTAFGQYSAQDVVSASINDAGAILVSRQIREETANDPSCRVTYTGSGC